MFKPGDHYQVKNRVWMVFSRRESLSKLINITSSCNVDTTRDVAAMFVDDWSRRYGCSVSFVSPGSCFTVVEVNGNCLKILGESVGWILLDEFKLNDSNWLSGELERIDENA